MANQEVVLAFSGGLDTSFCVPYLKEQGYRVVTLFVDTGGATVVKIEDRAVALENLDREFKDHVRSTGRKEMHLTVADDVPWGTEAKVYDAARGAEIHQIYWPKGK